MPLVALTYVLPTLGSLATLPEGSWMKWSTDGGFDGIAVGYATVLTQNLGPAWGYVFLVVAIVSQCAIFNTYLASGSRGFFVLADDHLCPPVLVKVSRSKGVPWVGILSLAAVTYILAQSSFTTLVSMEVVFMLALYIILPVSVVKLRRRIPVDERKKRGLYVMPGGRAGLIFYCGAPVLISVTVVYVIFKKLYGGFAVNDPEGCPVNRAGLAVGDSARIGVFMFLAGAMAFLGQFWLRWYEIDYGGWGPEDYDTFGSCIPTVLQVLKWAGLAAIAAGAVLFVFGMKKDAPLPEAEIDIDELTEKYLNEEKHESFFDD